MHFKQEHGNTIFKLKWKSIPVIETNNNIYKNIFIDKYGEIMTKQNKFQNTDFYMNAMVIEKIKRQMKDFDI